ncbi:uncharacterized protein LOC134189905 isoform X2 [Corticium candelabrum]|uniref:uncharacterized protein LOC134189905 isoform X2 n=1 Tax=Corticium candelabrum TaxID=121492 RepID=UPI002E26789F|nr:uncharacterized protein LOC134189905 isoform X2 [Corticium candelabrum]
MSSSARSAVDLYSHCEQAAGGSGQLEDLLMLAENFQSEHGASGNRIALNSFLPGPDATLPCYLHPTPHLFIENSNELATVSDFFTTDILKGREETKRKEKNAKQKQRDASKRENESLAFSNFDKGCKLKRTSTSVPSTKAEQSESMQVLSECFLEVYEDFSNESQIEDFLDVIRNEVKEKLSMLRVKKLKERTCKTNWREKKDRWCDSCRAKDRKKACLVKNGLASGKRHSLKSHLPRKRRHTAELNRLQEIDD